MAMFEIHAVDEQVKALPTYKTASGSIATFQTDMTENLISCIAEIVAQQASGTPTPINPLPISGFSAVNIVRCGINIWDEEMELGIYNSSTGVPEPSTTQLRSKNAISVKGNTSYYFHKVANRGNCTVIQYDKNGSFIRGDAIATGAESGKSFTTEPNTSQIRFYMGSGYGTTYTNDLSINYPSTDTDYHANNVITFTVSFGQTVYGGYIDVVTGKVTINKSAVTLDGTQPDSDFALSAMTGFKRITYNPYNNIGVIDAVFVSNILEYVSVYQAGEGKIWSSGTAPRMFLGLPDSVTNKSEMQAWFSNNPTQVVYELATPIELDVSSIAIPTLNGTNNIFADTGDIDEVKYILSVGEYLRQA